MSEVEAENSQDRVTSSIHESQLSSPRDGFSRESSESYDKTSKLDTSCSGDDYLGLKHEMLNEVQYEALIDDFEKRETKPVKIHFDELDSVNSQTSVKTNQYEK